MKNLRYGKFRFGDYNMSWGAIILLMLFAAASLILDLSFLFFLFPTVFAVVWLWVILVPHREQFVLHGDTIAVYAGKKSRSIALPLELTLVVSYADICPPLAIRTAVGDQTHILKDKYAVSILQDVPLDAALEALHRNYIQRYTTSTIQTVFDDYRFVYSFVCNQSLLDELIANRKCSLIIPESLFERISVDSSIVNVYIDTKC